MLKTLSLTEIFPATPNHIQAILRAKGAVEVYRLGGDIVYQVIK